MDQVHITQEVDVAQAAESQAEIEVLEIQKVILVKAAKALQCIGSRQQAAAAGQQNLHRSAAVRTDPAQFVSVNLGPKPAA